MPTLSGLWQRVPAWFAGGFGLLWFITHVGTAPLHPTQIAWLLQGDWAQHYFGWAYFRREPWGQSFGHFNGLLYPIGGSIALTDSMPLLALSFKLLSPLLPDRFQYDGLYLGLCFVLQGFFGAKLASGWTTKPTLRFLVGAWFACSPILLWRIVHESLCSQWLILWMLGLYWRQPGRALATSLQASIIVVLGAGLHPYWVVMLLPLLGALLVREVFARRLALSLAVSILAGTSFISAGLFALLGYFDASATVGNQGFGFFASDLLSWFNPMGWSVLIPSFGAPGGGYEGYAYVGLGGLVLGGIAVTLVFSHRRWPSSVRLAPLLVVTLALWILALGSHLSVAGHTVIDLSWLYDHLPWLTGPLRSSGRLVWPLYYSLSAICLALIIKEFAYKTALATLLVCFALQTLDMQAAKPFGDDPVAPLNSLEWTLIKGNYQHLALYPAAIAHIPHCTGRGVLDYIPFAELALRLNLTINSGYLARINPEAANNLCAHSHDDLWAGQIDPDTVYVATSESRLREMVDLSCGQIDGALACVSNRHPTSFLSVIQNEAR